MKTFYSYLMENPKRILGLLLLVTVLLAVFAARIQIESSWEGLIVEGDPDRIFFDKAREQFGNDEVLVLALVHEETIFRSGTLRKIQRISDELEEMDGVERVISLTTVYDVVVTPEGIEIKPLIEEIPSDTRVLDKLRTSVLENDLFLKTLVSDNGKATAINAFVEKRAGEEIFLRKAMARVEEIIVNEEGPESIYVAGGPYSKVALHARQQADMTKLSPLTGLVIALILLFSFGSIRGVVIPLFTVGIAIIWTMGVMSLLGKGLSAICTGIPSMIMAIGSAYTIHVLSQYYDTIVEGRSETKDLSQAFGTVSLPVSVAAITTLAGFVAITANRIPAIRDFGMFGVVGILSAWLLSLTFAPALLAILKARKPGKWGMESRGGSGGWLRRLAAFNIRNRRRIISISLVLFFLGLLGIRHLEVDTDYLSYLKKSDPLMQDLKEIERHFSGTVLWNVVVEGDREEIMKDPEIVHAIDRLQAYINRQQWVDKSTSFVDHLRLIYGALEGDKERKKLPDTREEISQCLLLYSFSDPEILDPFLNDDFSEANIQVRTTNIGSKEMKPWVQRIERHARQLLPKGLKVKVTGSDFLTLKTADQVASGQAISVSVALIVIFVVVWIMFLSMKVALISMVPNMIPIGILFGIMGWLGITLNTATSLIAALALGIAVDDTIHYLTRFQQGLKNTYSEKDAMREALVTTGRPITYTTVTLCLGFIVLCFSNFVAIVHFGFLMSLTIATCLLADIFFLPCMLLATKIITIWDLVLLKIGKDPHKTIPLFEGMRPANARVVVLMGMLKRYKKGEVILKRGEMGHEMYVVLSGEVEIFDLVDGKPKILALHLRGDIFGEMGPIRGTVRSASARAKDGTELLLLNEEIMARLQRKYPRISSRFFLNLSKILSNRLQDRTDKYLETSLVDSRIDGPL